MIFLEHYQTLKSQLLFQKQQEILKKVKKPIGNSEEKLRSMEKPLAVTDVRIGQDGSIWTYLDGGKEPTRNYPDSLTVQITIIYKKIIPLLAKNLKSQNWFQRIITILSIKYNYRALDEWFNTIFENIPVLLKEEHWSTPVKEIRRVLKGFISDRLIDAISLVIEYDSAYRYRLQDTIIELDKELFNNNQFKEIDRMFNILIDRDYDEMQKKWDGIRKLIKTILIINPKIKKVIAKIIKDLDINKVKMSKEDIYWTNQFPTYKYQGLSLEERLKQNEVNYK